MDSDINLESLREKALSACQESFARYRKISTMNTEKVLDAFRDARLSDFHFHGTTGYGYNDAGREKLDEVYATVFRAPAALVRPHFVSGTHTLATVLLSLLHKGDELVSVVGTPYDTMQSVIGIKGNAPGNLTSLGVIYKEVPTCEGKYILDEIKRSIGPNTKVALIQRSRGYSSRKSLFIEDIKKIIKTIKEKNPMTICFVDNCYGEFTEILEPYEVGADLVAGSLIKNPGGGLAPTGGYIVGREDLVRLAANQMTAPGLENEMGSYTPGYRLYFQGLFLAPHIVSQAMMGADFAAEMFSCLGFDVDPVAGELRSDLIQLIHLRTEENMCRFCEGLQAYSPVDGYVRPIPGELPGYTDPVIMACGAFCQGASIELSADGPIRSPYTVYLQGGLVFEHSLLALMGAARTLTENETNHNES